MKQVPLKQNLLIDRKIEVESYLNFLKIAVERRATLSAKDGQIQCDMSLELTHTLKASLVLLLYNAMEATLVQLLDEMHSAIEENCSSADELNEQLLKLVLKSIKSENGRPVDFLGFPLNIYLFKHWIKDWTRRASGKDKRVDGISGSVDGLIFYEQLKRFGVLVPGKNDRPPGHLTCYALQKIKNHRNILAHGENSFTDLGRSFSVEELESDAMAIFSTLNNIAMEVNAYLCDKRYLGQFSGFSVKAARTES